MTGFFNATASLLLAGLLPIMFGSVAVSEVMQRIAAPMIGNDNGALLWLFVILAAWRLLQERALRKL